MPFFEPPPGRTPVPGEWTTRAACKPWPTRWWYPGGDRYWGNPTTKLDMATALRICASCPVQAECLQHALTYREPGIWGGTTESQRRRLKREAS